MLRAVRSARRRRYSARGGGGETWSPTADIEGANNGEGSSLRERELLASAGESDEKLWHLLELRCGVGADPPLKLVAPEASIEGGEATLRQDGRLIIARIRSSKPRILKLISAISSLREDRSGVMLMSESVFSSCFVKELFFFAKSANLEKISTREPLDTFSLSMLDKMTSRSLNRILKLEIKVAIDFSRSEVLSRIASVFAFITRKAFRM